MLSAGVNNDDNRNRNRIVSAACREERKRGKKLFSLFSNRLNPLLPAEVVPSGATPNRNVLEYAHKNTLNRVEKKYDNSLKKKI